MKKLILLMTALMTLLFSMTASAAVNGVEPKSNVDQFVGSWYFNLSGIPTIITVDNSKDVLKNIKVINAQTKNCKFIKESAKLDNNNNLTFDIQYEDRTFHHTIMIDKETKRGDMRQEVTQNGKTSLFNIIKLHKLTEQEEQQVKTDPAWGRI